MIKLPSNPIPLLKSGWEKAKALPFGSQIFSRLLGQLVPYSGTVHPEILEVGEGIARVRMSDRRSVRNHLRSVHAMALANLGELATGLALNFSLPDTHRAILVGFQIEYLKKARGELVATCRTNLPKDLDNANVVVSGLIQNSSMEVVAKVSATWRVGPT